MLWVGYAGIAGPLRDIVHDSIASHYGVLLALYALMQFMRTVLGALSDRFAAAQFPLLRYLEPLNRPRDHGDHTCPVDIRI